ncbi:hypothetical protein CNMCM5623_003398 [Aspergillus felis]|uniref:DUF829-domain-containing protein n=1 Tax=Aspergillus felis TaxID=1287682 RepID=A0A8H6QD99_9EURO|nr:hypothetical protein CNMCM5623_003398 [Aspergillus felis]
MATKSTILSDFTRLSEQVFVRQPNTDKELAHGHPRTVLIYGWGNALPIHVVKYANAYRELYPDTQQVVVFSSIARALFSDLKQRTNYMIPVVKTVFDGPERNKDSVLVHVMSNTGVLNYAATLNAYHVMYNKPLPHLLLVLDSAPGSTDITVSNVIRWSRAMAIHTAGWHPWLFRMTQAAWMIILTMVALNGWLIRRKNPGATSFRIIDDEMYETRKARRLYMYGEEDDIVPWEDVKRHITVTRVSGWQVDAEEFQGTRHVEHMRRFPGRYWCAVRRAWEKTVGSNQD